MCCKVGMKEHDIVRHFKYEEMCKKSNNPLIYTYEVLGIAKHTETGELFVVYKSLYDGTPDGINVLYGQLFARPYDMFISEVDHKKYPNIKQKYRFEVIGNTHYNLNEGL